VISVNAARPTRLIRRDVIAEPECRAQCPSLWRRQRLHAIEERRQQLVERGKAETHLRLDADEAQHVEVACRRCDGLEQARLADACPPVHHQHTAQTAARLLDDTVERGLLRLAPNQGDHTITTPTSSTGSSRARM
jgi:hypothetical protein